MNSKVFIKALLFGVAMLGSAKLLASTCQEVMWSNEVLDKYPAISEYCQSVVERDGKSYVELDAKFISAHAGKAKLQFKHPDGSYGETIETEPASDDFRVIMNGRPTRIRDIPRNSELTIFMPPDRFELASEWDNEDAYPVATLMAYEEVSILPSTGSSLPVYGLAGVLACLMGLGLSFRRRFFS